MDKKNEPKFTKGPWFCTCIGHVKECMGDPPKTVATIPGLCSEVKMDGITEKQANADLIAAAPDMYELLDRILGRLEVCKLEQFVDIETEMEIRQILAKARGEERE